MIQNSKLTYGYVWWKAIANDLKDKTIDQVYKDYEAPVERQFTPEEREKVEEVRVLVMFITLILINQMGGGMNATHSISTYE